MIKFENHHNNKTTYIMGNYCLNGCQLFHKDDAQTVFVEFNVSKQYQNDVLNSFDISVNENLIELYNPITLPIINNLDDNISIICLHIANGLFIEHYIDFNINLMKKSIIHYYFKIFECIAKYGNDEHRDELLFRFDDKTILQNVVKYGNDHHKDLLLDNEHDSIRTYIAKYGNNEHRTYLLNDISPFVRTTIAIFGNDEHREYLLNDEMYYVRKHIAMYGNTNQRQYLMNDKIEAVRNACNWR